MVMSTPHAPHKRQLEGLSTVGSIVWKLWKTMDKTTVVTIGLKQG